MLASPRTGPPDGASAVPDDGITPTTDDDMTFKMTKSDPGNGFLAPTDARTGVWIWDGSHHHPTHPPTPQGWTTPLAPGGRDAAGLCVLGYAAKNTDRWRLTHVVERHEVDRGRVELGLEAVSPRNLGGKVHVKGVWRFWQVVAPVGRVVAA